MRTTDRRFSALQQPVVEHLEQRAMLDATPLPDISELLSPSNTVVRFETNYGDVDIELFDTEAPVTVANFLKYIRDGDYDQTIFHRLAKQGTGGTDPFVIQGGLSRLKPDNTSDDALPFIDIPVDAPIINEHGIANRSNSQKTISMARRGGQVNSATSQFFFNMANNTFLDTVDQGFTVFGHVLNDSSWMVLQAIDALVKRDIDTNDPNDAYGEVPTTSTFNRSDGIQPDELALIVDAEIIKPANVAAFYQYRYYFPEGFAGNNINEFVPLINAGASTASYQIIVRAEKQQVQPPAVPGDAPDPDFWYRDKVIVTSTVLGNRRSGQTISLSGPGDRLVARNIPFAYEIWSTRPLGASLSHYANGSTIGESFTDTPATKWTLPDLRKGGDNRDFVLWQNTSDETVNITVNFFFANSGQNFTFNGTTEAFRRGGFNVHTFGTIPDGDFSVQITADQPIVVSRTHYNVGTEKSGGAMLALTGDGIDKGILPLGNWSSDTNTPASEEITIFNPGSTVAIVTLIFSFDDNSPDITISPASLIIQPMERGSFDLSNVAGLDGKRFTVKYQAVGKPLYASTNHNEFDDDFSTGFQYTAAVKTQFAEGFMNRSRAGVDLFETISVYNPYSAFLGQADTTADLTFRFLYNNGTVITHTVSIDGGKRIDLDLHEFEPILAQSDMGRRNFSIEVVSSIPVMASMRHTSTRTTPQQAPGGFMVTGRQVGPVAFADLADALM